MKKTTKTKTTKAKAKTIKTVKAKTKTTKTPITTIVSFILDETGSMDAVKDKTISGFNEYIKTLKTKVGADNFRFTLTKFNSAKVDIVHSAVRMKEVTELTDKNYQPNNCTPLLDAIGNSITTIQRKMDTEPGKYAAIMTDGAENASREYSHHQIVDLIAEKKKAGWEFVFLGADIDAYAASQSLGIAGNRTLQYGGANTKGMYQSLASATVRTAGGMSLGTNISECHDYFTEQERAIETKTTNKTA
jgi:hypothetical protein